MEELTFEQKARITLDMLNNSSWDGAFNAFWGYFAYVKSCGYTAEYSAPWRGYVVTKEVKS